MKGALVRFLAILLAPAAVAVAGPIVNILFDPGSNFSTADQTVVQNAVNFYTSTMTSSFTVTIAFAAQAGGGGSSQWFTESATYSDFYTALVAHSSGDATDTSAISSLGAPGVNNPVTNSPNIVMTTTLASLLGLGAQASTNFADCGNLSANACITLSQAALNIPGTPLAGLNGIVQHEVDEVLGTASNLPNGGGSVPTDPLAADLYRYGSAGVRSFAVNTSTNVPCSGVPTAYFSINSGNTDLQDYNNCNNGGDYGDWIGIAGTQVQDAFGPDSQAASLTLSSPESRLLDAVGYNFASPVPEPSPILLLLGGLAAIGGIQLVSKRNTRIKSTPLGGKIEPGQPSFQRL